MRCSFDKNTGFLCISADIFDDDASKFKETITALINEKSGTIRDFRTGKLVEIGSILLVTSLEIMGIISKDAIISHIQFFKRLAKVKFHEKQDDIVYSFFKDHMPSVIIDHYDSVPIV